MRTRRVLPGENRVGAASQLGPHEHAGPDLDVLIHVLGGSGTLTSERGTLDLEPGVLAWLPRRSLRQVTAGPDGLRYLKPGL